MARYLSAAWFDDVARYQPAAGGVPLLTLCQVVTGAPEGDVGYRVLVEPGGARLEVGVGPGADVTFTTDWATASAVASGQMSMQSAMGAGRVRVSGDLELLATHQTMLSGMDPVPAPVRERTTWEAADE